MGRAYSSLPPLQVIVCREGDSDPASELARAIRDAFRGNVLGTDAYLATMSDLPIPLRSFTACPGDAFRAARLLDGALHTLVVVLVDEALAKSARWRAWLTECAERVAGAKGRHHVLALCLSDSIKKRLTTIKRSKARFSDRVGYDDRQRNREFAFGEYAERKAWFALYVLQSCRHLLAEAVFKGDKEKLKLRLFISHAKKDSLPLANSVRYALERKSYFSAWYDAVDLAGLKDWRQGIRDGVHSSVVVVLRTEQYDTRPWCRQEFLWADQCAVPIVCVEARTSLEYESDPLSSSRAPTVRIPDGNLFRVLFIALKESLRIMRLERLKKELQSRHAGLKRAKHVELIPYTPELRQLAHAARAIKAHPKKRRGPTSKKADYNVILYADPPLVPELYHASKNFVASESGGMTYLLTPTLIPFWASQSSHDPENIRTRSLLGHRVNISISEGLGDFQKLGFSDIDMQDMTVQIAQTIIANEGIVMLGHDWRPDGVMQRIFRFAEEHQDVVLEEEKRKGLIENYLLWGATPGLNERERRHMKGIIDIIMCDHPGDALFRRSKSLRTVPKSRRRFALVRSLTQMRHQMTSAALARICLGGKDGDPDYPKRGPKGRCPGVVEEAYLSCVYDKPLYVSKLLGGVTEQVALALEGKDAELKFELIEEAARHFPKGEQRPGDRDYDGPLDSDVLLDYFRGYGIDRLSRHNKLSPAENLRLFKAVTTDEVLDLVLTGLSRLVAEDDAGSGNPPG